MVYQKLCQNNCQGRDHWEHSTAPRLGLTAPEEVSFEAALAVPRCRTWPWVKKKHWPFGGVLSHGGTPNE
jgi:hypothetical protein